ncbi:MAG TPA: 6-phosphofructokinase [Deinococcales bacterium]|nr:6-phosphofructokinase [Deinococcales bacterium]
MKRIGVFTSGGDAPGMNAAVRAVVRTAASRKLEVIGIRRGYAGMIDGDFEVLGPRKVANTIQRGGTILLTARSRAFMEPEGRALAAAKLREAGIEGLVAVGGDGTFHGATLLDQEQGIPTVGVPGTIDNDLYGTDYTIGYDTAVNTALDAIDRIRDTAASHERLFFVEVMGRHAGFIALDVGIAGGAEEVVIPEDPCPAEQVVATVKESVARGKASSIIVVAEGIPGGAMKLMEEVTAATGLEARTSILGHVQRGGTPTAADRILASRLGEAAVDGLQEGRRNVMVGVISNEVVFTPFPETWEKRKSVNDQLYRLAKTLSI